jgi:hypothetical protein
LKENEKPTVLIRQQIILASGVAMAKAGNETFFNFKKAEYWQLDIDRIPPAVGFHTLHVVLARRRLSVMALRNSHPDATRFSAALSMIEIFRSGRTMPHANQAAAPSLLRC